MQFQVNDITRANIAGSSFVVKAGCKRSGAADDSMMGAQRSGGPDRLSAAEFQGTMRGSMARLQRVARVVGMQAYAGHRAYVRASHAAVDDREIIHRRRDSINNVWRRNLAGTKSKSARSILLMKLGLIVRDGSIPGGSDLLLVHDVATIAKAPELSSGA